WALPRPALLPAQPTDPWAWSQHEHISPDSTARSTTRSRAQGRGAQSHQHRSDACIRGRRVTMKVTIRRIALATSGVAVAMFATACGSGGFGAGTEDSDSTDGATIDVIAVNLPAQEDLVEMTAEHFTPETGITVNFTLLPENDVRAKITQEFSSQAGVYDVASLSNYEIPFYADNGWVAPIDDYLAEDSEFDRDDMLDSMMDSMTGSDGVTYGLPFEGQS